MQRRPPVGLSALPDARAHLQYWAMTSVEEGAEPGRGVWELSPAECMDLLGSASVGRLGVTIDALPAVLPVNFVVSEGAVVFRTVPGTKLDAATHGAVVAFEADAYGTSEDPQGWSVLVRGLAHEVTEPDDLAAARQLPLESWAFDGGADRFVRIEPSLVTGRRVVGRRVPDQ
jgi:hypothetical protein